MPTRYLCLAACALIAASCASAKVVHRDLQGGTLALHGHERKAYEKAHEKMAYHCNGPYQIVEEGQVVVGEETVHVDETYEDEDGTIVHEGATQTRDVTEWRVTYECIDDPPPGEGVADDAPGPAAYDE